MLSKIHISPNSNTEKLRSTTELVIDAIDGKVAQDAPSRNALQRLHSTLSRALGDAEKVKTIPGERASPGGENDGLTNVDDQTVEGSVIANEEDTRMDDVGDEGITEVQDFLSEEV